MIKRRRKEKMGLRESSVIRCPGHLKWVRGFHCLASLFARAVPGLIPCGGNIEAHHVRTRGAGGGDEQVVPLCHDHHMQLDSPGWSAKRFEEAYRLHMAETAASLWRQSPHRIRYEDKRKDRSNG